MSYCKASRGHPLHGPYHDHEYGFPVRRDAALFERLALEINQAGLSWLTMLQKREGFRRAFDGFDPARVASFDRRKYKQLLMDPGIVRNRLKIRAVIENARRIEAIREAHGSFANWLDSHHPRSEKEWGKLFRETFVFTGGKIVRALLTSTGYLPGAHEKSCPIYAKVSKKKPAWTRAKRPSPRPSPRKRGEGDRWGRGTAAGENRRSRAEP